MRREFEVMTCVMCGKQRAWTDGFPSRRYAECWQCAWNAHQRDVHPPPKPKLRLRKPWHRAIPNEPPSATVTAFERVGLSYLLTDTPQPPEQP